MRFLLQGLEILVNICSFQGLPILVNMLTFVEIDEIMHSKSLSAKGIGFNIE